MDPTIGFERLGGATLVRLAGAVDISNSEQARAQITGTLRPNPGVVALLLDDLEYCDSAGVRLVFDLGRDLGRLGGELRVVIPPQSPIRRLFALVQLGEAVPVYETAADATNGSA